MKLLKHPKERYILLAITIIIPAILIGGYLWGSVMILSMLGDNKDFTNATVNDTHAEFNLTEKSYLSYSAVTNVGNEGHHILKEDLDRMEFDVRYRCEIVSENNKWFYPMLNVRNYTLGNCTRL